MSNCKALCGLHNTFALMRGVFDEEGSGFEAAMCAYASPSDCGIQFDILNWSSATA